MITRALAGFLCLEVLVVAAGLTACAGEDSGSGGGAPGLPTTVPSTPVDQIGSWDDGSQTFARTYHIRPPGQTYGTGDGSSWTNAYADLPENLERGARYLLASGDYDQTTPQGDEPYTDYTFDDAEDGDGFIAACCWSDL